MLELGLAVVLRCAVDEGNLNGVPPIGQKQTEADVIRHRQTEPEQNQTVESDIIRHNQT